MQMVEQRSLFPEMSPKFPSTRYHGSKAKLVDWIRSRLEEIGFTTCLDAFGGTGTVAYKLRLYHLTRLGATFATDRRLDVLDRCASRTVQTVRRRGWP